MEGVILIEADYESLPGDKRQQGPDETCVPLRRTDRLVCWPKFSEANQRKLEEMSHEKLLDQMQSSAPDEVTIPSRLLNDN